MNKSASPTGSEKFGKGPFRKALFFLERASRSYLFAPSGTRKIASRYQQISARMRWVLVNQILTKPLGHDKRAKRHPKD
jgi:hypothetical protein